MRLMCSLRSWVSVLLFVAPFGSSESARAAQGDGDRPPTPSATPSFTCVIVDGRDDLPIAGVEVRWYEPADEAGQPMDESVWLENADELALEDYSEYDALVAGSEEFAISDAKGRVTIPGAIDRTIVVARSGALWGQSSCYVPRATEYVLALFPDADVVARVLDAEGRPDPDVPVVVQYRLFGDQPFAKLRGTSDQDGVARIPHAGYALAQLLDGWDAKSVADSKWSIAPQICAVGWPEVALDPRAPPNAPIELRLPPLGEVELRVLRFDGQPANLELWPQLLLAANLPDGVGSGPTRGFGGGPGPRVRARPSAGQALFRHVGLGAELAVKVQANSASQPWVERFQGPKSANERVSVTVTLASASPTFVGRLVDPDRRPLANTRITTRLFSLPSATRIRFVNRSTNATIQSGRGTLATDADGRFSLSYARDAAYGGVPLLALIAAENEPNALAARVELAELWTDGAHELGDVVLAPPPVVAAGKVVDAEGRPIAGASLGIAVFKGPAHIMATSDANGAFELRSVEPLDELLILVSAKGNLDGHVRTSPGAHDLRIELVGAGSITGPIVFPADARFGDFYFNIQRSTQGREHHGWVEQHPGEGDLLYRDIEPGTYSIYVKKRGAPGGAKVARSGIEVRAGETAKIEPIDLVALFAPR